MDEINKKETVTLIRGESRFEVDKQKLAKKAQYFASLFAHNFNDSQSKEHVINYDISTATLQNFVEWVEDDEEPTEKNYHPVKTSMVKFLRYNFADLLHLLQLSVLYIVDSLTNEVIDIIVLNWLLPEKVIDVWLLAQDLCVIVLRDICFSVCLDRFKELPVPKLVQLSKENLVQLLENNNIRSSVEYLSFVREEWTKHHMIPDITDIKKERKPKFVQGMVMHKMNEYFAKDSYLYTWDGNVLSECTQLKELQKSDKGLLGMQVAGRGFSVYMIGGEFGLGTGKFNKVIWRYCLISKKWYYQANLPVVRRHMIAVFLKDKLVIVGGIGRYRFKLSSVDVLNIHTGEWSKGEKVPEYFTDMPPHCVVNGKLFFIKSSLYIFDPDSNQWETILIDYQTLQKVDTLMAHDATLFLTGSHLSETILSRIEVTEDSACEDEECLKYRSMHSTINNVNIVYVDESCELRYAQVTGIGIVLVNGHQDHPKNTNLYVHTAMRMDLGNSSFNPRLGYFNIINSHSLHDKVSS